MAKYSLSKLAAVDFERIFEFGIDAFGLDIAHDYQTRMEERFRILADYPYHYPATNHILEGSRMSVFGAHSIYYKIQPDYILILRILGRQSAEEALKE